MPEPTSPASSHTVATALGKPRRLDPGTRSRHEIVIVGAGVSGTLVAAHLLRRAPAGVRITLIERKPPFGRGVAYGTLLPVHRLNVPAAKMSASPDAPDHFLQWAKSHRLRLPDPTIEPQPTDFLPRYLFGEYIESVLEESRAAMPSGVSFSRATGEVVDVSDETPGPKTVLLADGTSLPADQIVLALGNLPGEYPIRKQLPIYRSIRYVHVPWLTAAVENIDADQDVLVVGAGLTATDIVLQLDAQGHRGRIHALSRRGLRPQPHAPAAPYPAYLEKSELPLSLRALTRRIRSEITRANEVGSDWRAVIDALRPLTGQLWAGLSPEDRARFMRHLRPFWETHRHRLAPAVGKRISDLERLGRLRFHAGRLVTLEERNGAVHAEFRERRTGQIQTLRVGRVINCTGPRTDYSKFQHPLLINLLARGFITHDPLALGLSANAAGEVISYSGTPSGWLYTLGAPMKGVLWECTAVPEIRVHASQLADTLIRRASAG